MFDSNAKKIMTGVCLFAMIALAGCSQVLVPNALDPANAPAGDGWRPMFNGKDMSGWHQRQTDAPMSWKVVDGVMVNTSSHEQKGVDIVSDETFDDFEVYYEYRISAGSNSGFYLRGRYEIQILDDYGKEAENGGTGGFYSKAAPCKNAGKPVGEWQSVYARIVGRKTSVILNGEKIHCGLELTGPTGGHLDNDEDKPGPIMIQGNHGSIDMRNVWIRPFKCPAQKSCAAKACAGPCCAKTKCPKAAKCDKAKACPIADAKKCPKAEAKKCPKAEAKSAGCSN